MSDLNALKEETAEKVLEVIKYRAERHLDGAVSISAEGILALAQAYAVMVDCLPVESARLSK